MAIEFPCPHCSQLLRVADDSAGKTAKCPKCSGLAKIPASGSAPAFAPLPSAGSGASTPVSNPFSGPSAPSNPFSEPPGGSSYGAPPPKPFSPAGEVNPYSSPAATSYAPYTPSYGYGAAGRSGLPWDTQSHSFGTWWATLTMILGSANDAFRRMHIHGGLGRPILYAIIGMGIGSLGQLLVQLAIIGIGAAAGGGMPGEAIALQVGIQIGTAIVTPLLGATIGCMIRAAILHVCLMMVGGEKNGYEATFRVCAYNAGTFGAFAIIPIVGPCVGAIWEIVATIIGLMEAHETTGGKAALAFFLPLLVCGGLALVLGIVIFGIIASNGGKL